MSQGASIRRARGAPFRALAGEVLIAAPGHDDLDVLNGSAAAVWMLLEEPRTVAGLVAELAARFEAPPAVLERDLRGLVDRLRSTGAIEVGDGD